MTDLKEMSNEELLNRLDDGDNQDVHTELLSRLELGKQAIEIVDELYTWNLESFPHLKDMVIEFMKKREEIK